jgi:hypothetical protein
MQTQTVDGIYLVFSQEDVDSAETIKSAISKSLILNHQAWGLNTPADCQIYVITSWWSFTFQSAPWLWKLILAINFPFWAWRARKVWPYAGGLTQRYGRRVAIGIKPPILLEKSDRSFGLQMYVPEPDPLRRIQHFTCHELTHACTAQLRLPAWLNEGLAMFTVDRFMGMPTIRDDTLERLQTPAPQHQPPGYTRLTRMQPDVVVYYTLLGYWLVRYLEELQPSFLKLKLSGRLPPKAYEREIARCLNVEITEFWSTIPGLLLSQF